MTNEQPDRLDLILEAAIREYSNAEPRAGFERRILRHVQTAARSRLHWRFAWALCLVAMALIVVIALPKRRVSAPLLALSAPPVPRAARPVVPALPSRRRIASRPLLRRNKEPEPLPLTAEERALLRLVREQPALAEAMLSQPELDRPAELEALKIEPLKIEELQLP